MTNLDFNTNALQLFATQFTHNSHYQNYCLQRNKTPKNIEKWQEIPAVVTDVFKSVSLSTRTGNFTPSHIFHTSGTTGKATGKHAFPNLDAYQKSVLNGWPSQLKNISARPCFFLDTPPKHRLHSSLNAMYDILATDWELTEKCWLRSEEGSLDSSRIRASNHPIFLFGTASAFIELFQERDILLPVGSVVMETGGYKATGLDLEKSEFYQLFEQHLGIPTDSIWNEYSMTELSSQFYTKGIDRSHRGPNWVRTRVIDPATGHDTPLGEPGYLVIYDLANEHSILAIQTQDIAIATRDDHRSFKLIGRDPKALPRGCSRAIV